MNYKNKTLPEVIDQPGFYWFIGVESVLIVAALVSAFNQRFEITFLIFILIELRDLNINLKDKG